MRDGLMQWVGVFASQVERECYSKEAIETQDEEKISPIVSARLFSKP